MMFEHAVPPTETDEVPDRLAPLIVIVPPGQPEVGLNDVIVGGATQVRLIVKVPVVDPEV